MSLCLTGAPSGIIPALCGINLPVHHKIGPQGCYQPVPGGAVQYGYLFPAPVDPVKRYLCFEFVDYCCFPLFDHVMPDAVPISEIMHIRPDEFLQPGVFDRLG